MLPDFLNIALAYAARGWRVFPCAPRAKVPATKNGCHDATTDPDRIRDWWTQTPDANIGLATGRPKTGPLTGEEFFVVDIDEGGDPWYRAHDFPITHESCTGRGGRHLLFAIPSGATVRNSAGTIHPGVDIRGDGGYIVAAPSIHPSGATYGWLDCDGDVPDGPCAEAPDWLVEAISAPSESTTWNKLDLPTEIGEGGRNDTLFRAAASMRAKTMMTEPEIRAALGALNNERCKPPLPQRDIDTIARQACKFPQGRSSQFELIAPPAGKPVKTKPTADESQDDGSGREKLSPNAIGDLILKDRPIINIDSYIYEYTGTHWKLISPGRIKSLAMEIDGKRWSTQKRRSEVASYIADLTHRTHQDWRLLDTYEVPVANGVIDIRSMSIRPHRQEDMLQACIPVGYNSAAQCPWWMRSLDMYFGGDDEGEAKVSVIQEFFGYCLMPHALYKKALVCYGESNCGKSTIPYLIRKLLGGENISSVALEDMDDPRKIAPMMGKLVNLLGDLPTHGKIGEGGFKKLVSVGETIQFDPKYLPPIEAVSTTKVLFCANPPLPRITDESSAMFERLLLVHFLYEIPAKEQDKGIQEKLAGELEGILLWALEGAQRLSHNGGRFTPVGAKELAEYRREQNPVNDFITEFCMIDPEQRIPLVEFQQKFNDWHGRRTTPQKITSWLRTAGFEIGPNPVYFGNRKARPLIGLSFH